MKCPEDTAGLLVSTIIPTFNRRELVVKAIESVLAQSYRHQEIVVVDDGSTDGTAECLLERYGSRIKVVTQSNRGVSAARNHGVRVSRGKLIAFLDSDDAWEPEKLGEQVAFLAEHSDYSMVLTDVKRVDGEGMLIDVFRRRDVIRNDGDVFLDVLLNPSLVPASVLVTRNAFEAVGGFDERLSTAEDIDFHLRIAASFKVGVVSKALTIAARSGEGLSSVATSDRDYVSVVERVLEEQKTRIPKNIRRRVLFRTYIRNSRSSFLSHRLVDGVTYLVRSAVRLRSWADFKRTIQIMVLGLRALIIKGIKAPGHLLESRGKDETRQ